MVSAPPGISPLHHRYHPFITCFPSPAPFLSPLVPVPRAQKKANVTRMDHCSYPSLINFLPQDFHPWALIGLDDFTPRMIDDRLLFMNHTLLCTINLLPHARLQGLASDACVLLSINSRRTAHLYDIFHHVMFLHLRFFISSLMYMLWTVEVLCPFFLHLLSGR